MVVNTPVGVKPTPVTAWSPVEVGDVPDPIFQLPPLIARYPTSVLTVANVPTLSVHPSASSDVPVASIAAEPALTEAMALSVRS